jgi:tRNA 2-thiouridine synthesizing protein E
MSTDLTPVLERLDALAAQVQLLTERQRAHDELIADMTPIAREAMAVAITKLDALDRDGFFTSLAGMLETVRAITQPDVLDAKPVGLLGVARAARKDDDVRKGLAVLVEMLRRIGNRAENAAAPPPALDRKAHLAAMLGPRRARPQLPAPASLAPVAAAAPARAPACATPSPAATADPAWTRAKGAALAAAQGLTLTDAHWAVLDAARADFAASQVSPNIRRLTQVAGVTTKDLYVLFPKAPGRTIAAIAGLPKPAGCL